MTELDGCVVLENTNRQEDELDRGFWLWWVRIANSCPGEVEVQFRYFDEDGDVTDGWRRLTGEGTEGAEFAFPVTWKFDRTGTFFEPERAL